MSLLDHNLPYKEYPPLVAVVVVVVDCGLTSHSAIFQLYSDGTDVQFPNFDLLQGTHAMGIGTSEDVFYLLAISGPTRGEGKRGIEPGSSDPKSSPLPLRHRGGISPSVIENDFILIKYKPLI